MSKEYRRCFGCDRPLRPRRALLEDNPGTLREARKGLCLTCATNEDNPDKVLQDLERREKGNVSVGDLCEGECKRPLRLRRMKADEAPGTVAHYGLGKCRRCYHSEFTEDLTETTGEVLTGRSLRALQLPPAPPGLTWEEKVSRDWIEGMIANRRKRGIPVRGLPPQTLGVKAA